MILFGQVDVLPGCELDYYITDRCKAQSYQAENIEGDINLAWLSH